MVSTGLWELQTGSKFDDKATDVEWTDYLTVDTSNSAKTSYIAVGTAGAEIEGLFIKDASGLLATELTQVAGSEDDPVVSGTFSYTPGTKTLQMYSDVDAGTEIVAFYKRKIQAAVLANSSDKYSGKCAMYIDAIGEDKCANIYHVQIFIPKADFSGEFSFDMGDNQTIHSFEAEALSGACGTAGEFFTYTVFGQTTPDYTGS